MPARKRTAAAAGVGLDETKKKGVVRMLEIMAEADLPANKDLFAALEFDITPEFLLELFAEHPAAERSYRVLWLRSLSRRAQDGHPFEEALEHLQALSNDADSRAAHLRSGFVRHRRGRRALKTKRP